MPRNSHPHDCGSGSLIDKWLAEEREREHAQGIVHGITSTGGFCLRCLLSSSAFREEQK